MVEIQRFTIEYEQIVCGRSPAFEIAWRANAYGKEGFILKELNCINRPDAQIFDIEMIYEKPDKKKK